MEEELEEEDSEGTNGSRITEGTDRDRLSTDRGNLSTDASEAFSAAIVAD